MQPGACRFLTARPSGLTWPARRLQSSRLFLDTLRECYEAFVIYNFFMYLLTYLHEEYGDVDAYFSTKEQARRPCQAAPGGHMRAPGPNRVACASRPARCPSLCA